MHSLRSSRLCVLEVPEGFPSTLNTLCELCDLALRPLRETLVPSSLAQMERGHLTEKAASSLISIFFYVIGTLRKTA
jgi:hypothetical protein